MSLCRIHVTGESDDLFPQALSTVSACDTHADEEKNEILFKELKHNANDQGVRLLRAFIVRISGWVRGEVVSSVEIVSWMVVLSFSYWQ